MRIAIVDDLDQDRGILKDFLVRYIKGLSGSHDISLFESGESFLKEFYQGKFDLIFLDIYMKGLNGIETAMRLRSVDEDTRIIFTTTSNDFASESYNVNAEYYFLKPYSYEKFVGIMKRLKIEDPDSKKYVVMPDGNRIILRNIYYTEYNNRNVIVHNKIGEDQSIKITQGGMEKILLEYNFFALCMKGVIVNLYEIKTADLDSLTLTNGEKISVSRRKHQEFKSLYTDHLFRIIREGGE